MLLSLAQNMFSRSGADLKGLDAREQYKRVQWGREPDKLLYVDARHMRVKQRLIELGRLRLIVFSDGTFLKPKRPYPWLSFGERDNKLYFVGGSTAAMARTRAWGPAGSSRTATRIDYTSPKGRKLRSDGRYFYHLHDRYPQPKLMIHADGWPTYAGGAYTVTVHGIDG